MSNFTLQRMDMIVSRDAKETVDLSNETVESFTYEGVQVSCPSHQVKACKMILDARFNSLWEMIQNECIADGTPTRIYDCTLKAYLIPIKGWYHIRFYFTLDEHRQSA